MNTFLIFHHMGLLTAQPELARDHLHNLNYECGDSIYDPLQDVDLCMCHSTRCGPRIELVTPRATNDALSRLLRRKDDYMYHVCFSTPSIPEGVRLLEKDAANRIIEVMPPKPAILFNGKRVAFYAVPGLGLIELLEQSVAE